MSRITNSVVGAGIAVAVLTAAAAADFITPGDFGWARGDADSTYFEWDVFSSAFGGNDPDVGQFPGELPDGWVGPDVVETTGSAFVTGSGNLYSPFGPINVQVTVPNYGYGVGQTTLLLQVRTEGNELDYDNVVAMGDAPVGVTFLTRDLADQGYIVEALFEFAIDGNPSEIVIDIPTAEAHVSVNRIAVDTLAFEDACRGDFNEDGIVDTRDVLTFLNAWSAGEGSADINEDGGVDTRDVIAFLNLWTAGC